MAFNNVFVRRPVVEVYRPSVVGTIEYQQNKKELNFLCREFSTDPYTVALRRFQCKMAKLQKAKDALWKRYSTMKKISEGVSYSSVARIGASPSLRYSFQPVKKEARVEFMTRREARQDYTAAFKKAKAEREAARALVEAIAARRPKRVYIEKDFISFVERKRLREAVRLRNREKRYERRHPAREVRSFPLGCYQEKRTCDDYVVEKPIILQKFSYKHQGRSLKNITPRCCFITEQQVENTPDRKVKEYPAHDMDWINFLKFKIRMIILSFRSYDKVVRLYERVLSSQQLVGQMDQDGQVQAVPVDVDRKSNVVIQSEAAVDPGVSMPGVVGFKQYAHSTELQTFKTFTDRWLLFDKVIWRKIHNINDLLASFKVTDFIMRSLKDSQAAQLLFTNRFWRCDLKIKFVLNSSPWQTGMLVGDFWYGIEPDYNKSPQANVYSALQRNHIKLSAGSSNNAEMVVPYNNIHSFMSNKDSRNYFGILSLRVLNKLNVIDSVANQASVSIFVALENFDGHGLISRDLGMFKDEDGFEIIGQMDTIADLCNVGEGVLRVGRKIFNMDKPPLPLQPTCLIPQTVPSFAYTDGITEPINVLRADPRGQRIPAVTSQEMELMNLARKWGYLDKFSWSFSQAFDALLWRTYVRPLGDVSLYPLRETVATGVVSTVMPPIAFVSAFVSKCRGDIEYMFEVVGNKFYTGSLMVSAIPLGDYSKAPPIRIMNLSATHVLDIQQSTKLIVSVPWNWYNAWMNTPNLTTQYGDAFSILYVKVLNPLVGIDKIPPSIEINVYIRAGNNFEVTQFRTPRIALKSSIISPPSTEYLKPYNFEDAWYATWNRNISSTSGYLQTMYIQNVSDGWVGYTNVLEGRVYDLQATSSLGKIFSFGFYGIKSKDKALYRVTHGVYHEGLSSANAHGLVIFDSLEAALYFIKVVVNGKTPYSPESVELFLKNYPHIKYVEDGPWSTVDGQIATNIAGDYPIWLLNSAKPKGQMDTEPYIVTTEEASPITSMGLKVYGEEVPDVKGMSRRWQHYGSFVGKTCTEKYPRNCPYLFRFPVKPKRFLVVSTSHDYDNRIRDGCIALWNSCFAYWDGGMRYRLIVSHKVPDDTTIYVQHRFDDLINIDTIQPGNDKVLTKVDLMDVHYPTFVQALSINPVVSIEVPYQQSEERLFATSSQGFDQNGHIVVWAHGASSQDIHIEIYYSVADDFQWSVFQGCPKTFDIFDLKEEPKGQMDDRPKYTPFFRDDDSDTEPQGLFDCIGKTTSKVVNYIPKKVSENVVDQMISRKDEFDGLVKKVADCAVSFDKNSTECSEAFKKVTTKMESFIDTVQNIPSSLSESQRLRYQSEGSGGLLNDLGMSAFNYVTHLVYCLMNPNGKTIGWAILNLYKEVWGFTFGGFVGIIEPISNLWARASQAPEQTQPVGQIEDTDISSLCSLLYCSLCTALKVVSKPPTTWANVTHGLFEFGKTTRFSTNISQFVRDNITLLKRIWHFILDKFSFRGQNYKLIAGIEDVRLQQWCIHANAILNPSIREKLYTNPFWAEKVFELAVVGRAFSLVLSKDKASPAPLMRLINENMKLLQKFEEELINRKVFSGVRYEPFCMWVSGQAGTGKTRFLNHFADILAEESKSISPNTYHGITFGQAYFDGYVGQPTIVLDDFLAVSPLNDPTVPLFCQMKSSTLFNPPYSITTDKCKMLNFPNLLVSSNFTHIDNAAGIHDSDAYNRRRDLVVKFQSTDIKKTMEKTWTREQYENYDHITAFFASDVLKCDDWTEIKREPGKTYREVLDTFCLEKARSWHEKEGASYSKRCRDKIARIEKISDETLTDYLKKCEDLFSEASKAHTSSKGWWREGFFDYWVKPQDTVLKMKLVHKIEGDHSLLKDRPNPKKDPQTSTVPSVKVVTSGEVKPPEDKIVAPEEVKPQGDGDGKVLVTFSRGEPKTIIEGVRLLTDTTEQRIVEPLPRPQGWGTLSNQWTCLHDLIKDVREYVCEDDHFVKESGIASSYDIPYSFPVGTCKTSTNQTFESCAMNHPDRAVGFKSRIVKGWIEDNVDITHSWRDMTKEEFEAEDYGLPWEYVEDVKTMLGKETDILQVLDINDRLQRRIETLQEKMKKSVTIIGDAVLPNESRWRTVSRKVWRGFLTVCKWIGKAFSALERIVGFFGSLCCVLTVGAFGWGVYKCAKSPQPQIHPSGDYSHIKQSGSVLRTTALKLSKPQGNIGDKGMITSLMGFEEKKVFSDNPATDGRLRKIVNNCFTLVGVKPLDDENQMVFRARCIGLKGYKFIVLKHYIEHFEAKGCTHVYVVRRGKVEGVQKYKMSDIQYSWTDAGYGVGELPTFGAPFRDITKQIPSERFSGHYPSKMYMVEVNEGIPVLHDLETTRVEHKIIPSNNEQSSWVIENGFTYSWGGAGRCCSFLFAPEMEAPLVGIHTAGIGNRVGYSEVLLKETFVEREIIEDFVEPQMNGVAEKLDLPGSSGFICGSVDTTQAVYLPSKSLIIPSEIQGVFPVETEPAPLVWSDERLKDANFDPLLEGLRKRCESAIEFPPHLVEEAAKDLELRLKVYVKPKRYLKPLTVCEAVEGLELKGYDPMTLQTSAGYPWTLRKPASEKGKSWLFKLREENGRRYVDGINRELKQVLDQKMEYRKSGVVPATFYTACLKDARIKKSAVTTPGKTRLFEMSPVELTIAQRQYYLDFYAAYSNCEKAENTIGINCDGDEWTSLAEELLNFSPHILTADYSGYGPKLHMFIQKKVYEIQSRWFEFWERTQGIEEKEISENKCVREAMMYEMLHPYTVVGNMIVRFSTGMPSGNAGTVIINSLCNSLYIRIMYLILAKKHKPVYANMYWFSKLILMKSNGDDLIIAVKPEIIDWFNNESLISGFAVYDIKMTDAMKSGEVRKYCCLEEATYLKRGFVKHPWREGQYLAPLEEISITECANWIWRCINKREASLVNSEMACRLAYTRGPVFYKHIADTLKEKWLSKGVAFEFPSWDSLDSHVWDQEEGPKFLW